MSAVKKNQLDQKIKAFFSDIETIDKRFYAGKFDPSKADSAEQEWIRAIRARFEKEASTYVKAIDDYLDYFEAVYGNTFSPRYNPNVELPSFSPSLQKLLRSDKPMSVQAALERIKDSYEDIDSLYYKLRTVEPLHPLYYMLTAKTKLWPQVEVTTYRVDLETLAIQSAMMIRHHYANPTESVARAVSFSIGISMLDILAMSNVKQVGDFEISFSLEDRTIRRMSLTPAEDLLKVLPVLQYKSYISLKRVPAYDYFHPLNAHYFAWLHAFCASELHFDEDKHSSRERFLRQQGMTVYCSIKLAFVERMNAKDVLKGIEEEETRIRSLLKREFSLPTQREIIAKVIDRMDKGELRDLSRKYLRESLEVQGLSTLAISSALKVIKEHLNFSSVQGQCIELI